MTFPCYIELPGWRLHPHPVLETLGYFVGARVYFQLRRRSPAIALPLETNLWLLVGAAFGAWTGSKLLAWAESPDLYFANVASNPMVLIGGKTIVGGLLGGWAGVKLAKKISRVTGSTGDLFVWPLALGTALGRIGCFLTGLSDHTYGIATRLPWGVDFGDGIRRHPTQLYESGFVLLLAAVVSLAARCRLWPTGVRFRLYIAGYFVFRFAIEFLKPRETPFLGLSAIQLVSLAGTVIALVSLRRLFHPTTE
ncbi:MAG TPA: prolipoprotein diacylglyceryl transferase family protein [Opitutus sp.]|nr:prolipoprotein diacylglyceryl transferase family protein [Opitutus sp.]